MYSVQYRPLACIIAVVLAQPVLAQEAAAPPQPAEDITITGTRIKGLDLTGATQAITLDRDTILESGGTSIIEVLQELPQTSGGRGTFSTSNAGPLSGDTPTGASGVSLRGLGVSSTLTLINGRRASISSFANGQESFIDVNSIPDAAIDRVDVLPNGSSALYGADAVAGVVNFVLRDDFEGAEIEASYGDSTAGTNEGRFRISGVAGFTAGDHHFTFVGQYYKRNAFYLRDREESANAIRPSEQGFFPSFNDLFAMTFDQTEGPGGAGCPADQFGSGDLGEFCTVNTNAFVTADGPLESYSGMASHRAQLSDTVSWFNEVIYSRTESSSVTSPANFSRTPTDPENPNYPAGLKADLAAEAGCSRFSCFYEFPIFAWGKYPDPRGVEVTSDSYRIVSGFDVDLKSGWNWTTAVTIGGNDRVQRGTSGLVRSGAFYDLNLGNICTDGSRVDRWRVNAARPTASYVGNSCEAAGKQTLWYNPFGGQTSQAPGVKELLETTAERRGSSRSLAFDTVATGDLFSLGDRTVKAAFGAEWRNEKVSDRPSGEAVATIANPEPILGFSSTSVSASRTQVALFGELYIPVTDTLDVQLAGRYDRYTDFDDSFNPKLTVRWQPLDQLILRGNISTSFRAPSLAQSGAGVLLSSFRVRCAETPEACGGNPLATGTALLSEDVGNPDLEAEDATTWGVGGMWLPTRDITLKLDYWNINHRNLVGIDESDFIRRALAGEFPVVGQNALPTGTAGLEARNIIRDAQGNITSAIVTDAHFQLSNLGYQKVQGIDISYTHGLPTTSVGDFTLLFDATWLLQFDRQASADAELEKLAGDYLYPKFVATGRLRWTNGPWGATLSGFYTSGYRDDPDSRTLSAVGLAPGTEVNVPSYFTMDASVRWDIREGTELGLSMRNIFDKAPPRVLGSSSNVDRYNHDLVGRFVTVRLTQRF
jgi:outer membrane receptor protein involved in Fe transport